MPDEPVELWTPSPERIERAAITRFAREHDLPGDYGELWRWSVEDIERFWALIWSHFGVAGGYDEVLADRSMPGARWFTGASLNYAGHAFAGRDPDAIAIRHASELRGLETCTWGELAEQTARIRAGLSGPRRRPRRPRRRLPAEHPRDDPGLLRRRLAGRDLVLRGAGVRRPQRHRPLRADRAEGPARRRRLPLRRPRLRPERQRRGDRRRDPRPRAHGPLRLSRRQRLGGRVPRARGLAARVRGACPSTTRSGSSTRPARPGCRSRSSTATAGCCSST